MHQGTAPNHTASLLPGMGWIREEIKSEGMVCGNAGMSAWHVCTTTSTHVPRLSGRHSHPPTMAGAAVGHGNVLRECWGSWCCWHHCSREAGW